MAKIYERTIINAKHRKTGEIKYQEIVRLSDRGCNKRVTELARELPFYEISMVTHWDDLAPNVQAYWTARKVSAEWMAERKEI